MCDQKGAITAKKLQEVQSTLRRPGIFTLTTAFPKGMQPPKQKGYLVQQLLSGPQGYSKVEGKSGRDSWVGYLFSPAVFSVPANNPMDHSAWLGKHADWH